ncbi:HK97 gp10 family phage protein [Streptomyces sp. NPDC059786]|uniref:HK97 gp10 family phage protein n=1 Tax=Streptomyces sp. NPDC059786 TaxID=3346946 RepID=UPI0036490AEA
MAARVKVKRKGVGGMLRMPGMQAEMLRRAEAIKSIAQASSPVGDEGDPHRGNYAASWQTDSTARGGRRRDRAVAVVRNTSYYARWVEYGNGRPSGPAHHVLLRAAQLGGGNQ